jgi:hypothetical protein
MLRYAIHIIKEDRSRKDISIEEDKDRHPSLIMVYCGRVLCRDSSVSFSAKKTSYIMKL